MERQIMDAAAELFAKNGFEATSMDEVADKAGVAKGSLYYHFKGKSQLFARTAVDGIQFITRELQKSVNAAYSPQSAASQIIGLLVDICVDYARIADLVIADATPGVDDEDEQAILNAKQALLSRVQWALGEGMSAGMVRSVDARPAAAGLLAFVYAYCKVAMAQPGATKQTVKTRIMPIITKGLMY
ncbi:MAG: TetR/AcrR family transcriptional regulator [Clostridiales bacterium]|nr:TetR/AcrR family transcriptional regulator [Clostridiales bacterium]